VPVKCPPAFLVSTEPDSMLRQSGAGDIRLAQHGAGAGTATRGGRGGRRVV